MRRARSEKTKNSIAAVCLCTILLFIGSPALQSEKASKELIKNPVAPHKHSNEIQTEAFCGNLNDSNHEDPKDRNHAKNGHEIESELSMCSAALGSLTMASRSSSVTRA